MILERIAGICCCLVITSSVATAQQRSDTPGQAPAAPASSVLDRSYPAGDFPSWRRVQSRTESAGREVVVESSEARDVEGRFGPIQEVVRETIQTSPNATQTRRNVFGFAADRRRTLVGTTESLRETMPNGDTSVVHNTSVPDLDGRTGLTFRQIEQTTSLGPDARHSVMTDLLPHPNETLRETERTEYTERRIDPGVVRYDSTRLVRDLNGRWQPVETRRGEARDSGASERMEEETIQRLDMNGQLAVDERTVTRRSTSNEQESVVIETYAPYADGMPRSDNRLALSQRVHRTTTATVDGGRHTVEEVEGWNLAASHDPMRVIRRTVTTVRPIGTDRSVTERQVFERDVNGRLVLVVQDTEETAGK